MLWRSLIHRSRLTISLIRGVPTRLRIGVRLRIGIIARHFRRGRIIGRLIIWCRVIGRRVTLVVLAGICRHRPLSLGGDLRDIHRRLSRSVKSLLGGGPGVLPRSRILRVRIPDLPRRSRSCSARALRSFKGDYRWILLCDGRFGGLPHRGRNRRLGTRTKGGASRHTRCSALRNRLSRA